MANATERYNAQRIVLINVLGTNHGDFDQSSMHSKYEFCDDKEDRLNLECNEALVF